MGIEFSLIKKSTEKTYKPGTFRTGQKFQFTEDSGLQRILPLVVEAISVYDVLITIHLFTYFVSCED